MITDITTKLDQQLTNVNRLLSEMRKFDEIQSQIDAVRERIGGLSTSCSELEDKLVLLEDVYAEMQQNNNRFEHEYQLRKYRERKHLELEQIKGQCECDLSILTLIDTVHFVGRTSAGIGHLNLSKTDQKKQFSCTYVCQLLGVKFLPLKESKSWNCVP